MPGQGCSGRPGVGRSVQQYTCPGVPASTAKRVRRSSPPKQQVRAHGVVAGALELLDDGAVGLVDRDHVATAGHVDPPVDVERATVADASGREQLALPSGRSRTNPWSLAVAAVLDDDERLVVDVEHDAVRCPEPVRRRPQRAVGIEGEDAPAGGSGVGHDAGR